MTGFWRARPPNDWTRLLTLAAADTQALSRDAASFVPAAKVPAFAAAVNAACDATDGMKDEILNDPRQCKFDPATMECTTGEESDKCLTGAQVATLKTLYRGLHDSKGNQIFPGFLPEAEGGQGGWGLWITGPAPAKSLLAAAAKEYFSNFVYEKPDWDFKSFNVDAGLKAAEATTAGALNATDPDLKKFKARGGKLILYHGWDDPAIPAVNTVTYYESVIAKMGQRNVDAFVRLYMAPEYSIAEGVLGRTRSDKSTRFPTPILPTAWRRPWSNGLKRARHQRRSLLLAMRGGTDLMR